MKYTEQINPKKIAVLGAKGIVGTTLIQEIQDKYPECEIIAISRSYEISKSEKTSYISLDLNNTEKLKGVLEGVDIAFLTVGLEYKTSVWQEEWPSVMDSVIKACLANKTKLVFFDNVYSYGKFSSEITEDLPLNPVSKKGVVRKKLFKQLKQARSKGLEYLIAKSGEFYGPKVYNSSIYNACLENILKGKAGYWLGSMQVKRTYTYVPDAVKAMLILSLDESNYNQVWHLPTSEALTGDEYKEIFEKILAKDIKLSSLSKTMARITSIFNPIVGEILEMYYQFENDYIFNSDKFMAKYPQFEITKYKDGFKNSIESYDDNKL